MESFIGGKLLDVAGSKLTDVITDVLKKTWYFKSLLTEIKETMKKLNEKRDLRKEESNKFIDLIKEAEELIWECEQIKSVNLWKRYRHVKKLDELNKSLHEFVKSDNQFSKKMSVFERGSSSGWSSGVPLPDGDVIGFEDRVNDLKRMVLKESIVVVSAAGGCGKSTLVTMLCHDPEIQERFGRNIYFVTISSTPNLNVIIKRLLQKNHQGQLDFNNDEDATHQWGSFLNENISEEILLVLDDVWSDSIIMKFKFKSPGYRILVTSRFTFTQFKTYDNALVTPQVQLTNALPSKSKKRKLEEDAFTSKIMSSLNNLVDAIDRATKVMERSRPHVYSEVEIYQELELMGVKHEDISRAYLFLVGNTEKTRALFGVPRDMRMDILATMMDGNE